MSQGFTQWEVFYFILLISAIGFSVIAAWAISRSIYLPIKRLHDVTTTITKNDLQALMNRDNVDEITDWDELQYHERQNSRAPGMLK